MGKIHGTIKKTSWQKPRNYFMALVNSMFLKEKKKKRKNENENFTTFLLGNPSMK